MTIGERHELIPADRFDRALLIDEIAAVQSEEHLRDAGERPERTSGDGCLFAAGNGGLGILDAERRLPLEAANERLLQPFWVRKGKRLEIGDNALRIAKRAAQRDFAHPDRRAEAIGDVRADSPC